MLYTIIYLFYTDFYIFYQKWYAAEADKRISEIQGLLELSVQRSSCEKDHYKDRLFVYMKEQDGSSLPSLSTGIFAIHTTLFLALCKISYSKIRY